jgi:hypothetical protein
MSQATTTTTHAELEKEQEMLLNALAEMGIDPEMALEIAMEPLWIPAEPRELLVASY